jgi:signal transduction histidine kinase
MAQQLTNSCEINVEDNGVGISSDRKDKVFDMFYQASEKSVGSGLGLYIAKECVTKLGGEITVSTTLGEGSTFTVTIPQFNSI